VPDGKQCCDGKHPTYGFQKIDLKSGKQATQ
jgi:hypothetical protein